MIIIALKQIYYKYFYCKVVIYCLKVTCSDFLKNKFLIATFCDRMFLYWLEVSGVENAVDKGSGFLFHLNRHVAGSETDKHKHDYAELLYVSMEVLRSMCAVKILICAR